MSPKDEDTLLADLYRQTLNYLQQRTATTTRARCTVDTAIAAYSEGWNAKTDRLWRALPVEMLEACFEPLQSRDKVTLVQTSRYWRRQAMDMPRLWSSVIYPGCHLRSLRQLETRFRWSRTSLLHLELDSSWLDDDILTELQKQMHRVTSFRLQNCWNPLARTLLSRPLPLAKHVIIGYGRSQTKIYIPDLSQFFPNAVTLRLEGAEYAAISKPMPTLKSLEYHARSYGDRQLFKWCPNLETLRIICRHLPLTNLPEDTPPPHFKNFVLRNDDLDPRLSGYFKTWADHPVLETVQLVWTQNTLRILMRIYDGPFIMHIHDMNRQERKIALSASHTGSPRFVTTTNGPELNLGLHADLLSNLVDLELSIGTFLELGHEMGITLPSLAHLSIFRSWERWLRESTPTHCIHAPALRALTFRGAWRHECILQSPDNLRRLILFAAERLDSITFSEPHHQAFTTFESGTPLDQIAQEIRWSVSSSQEHADSYCTEWTEDDDCMERDWLDGYSTADDETWYESVNHQVEE
ncbi:hypothetical protein AURDEDRAFT_131249 [Auricularia subglabra TFB-10046 SS5]|uniref:Uncharacterized protein n=1 Tax=Auricularia subglabra (strain TFB-10046 / SS5) TaxID=717982 RepID=J0WPD2_AURST|nr:hypothetical protein AURDEDRAFT_131249 [Auricularia subglabra TFB-10046 SS5]